MTNDMSEVYALVNQLVGMKAWGITVNEYHSVFLKFGRPVLNSDDGDIDGEWELHVKNVDWRLESPEEMLIGSSDEMETIEGIRVLLEDQAVTGVKVLPPALELRVIFENRLSLLVFPIRSRRYTGWWLFTPHKSVLIAGPGSQWSIDEAN